MKRGMWLRKRRKPIVLIVAAVWRAGLGPCVVCGSRVNVDGHHIVPAQTLRRHGLHAYLMDKRNRLSVCRDDHEAHHNRSRPILRGLLPAAVSEFADELGLTWYLDRHYPFAVAA